MGARRRGLVVERARSAWSAMSGSARAEWYAAGVRDGKIPACLRIRQAVGKWWDLRGRARYNADRVDRVCRMIASMKPPEGDMGSFLIANPWQAWATSWIYGFETEGGDRLVRQCLITVPRKAGKSTLTAAWGLCELVAPWGNYGGIEVAYCGVTEDTAKIAYNKLRRMLERDKLDFQTGFCKRHQIINNASEILVKRTSGRAFKLTTGGRNIDGLTLRLAVVDEIAAMDDAGAIETIRSGMGHDRNSLVLLTTTPHDKWTSAYDEEKEVALQWLEGDSANDRYCALLYRAETADLTEEFSPALWERVHPSLGNTVDVDFYRSAAEHAKVSPVNLHRFRTRLLCADSVLAGVWVAPAQLVESEPPPPDPPRDLCSRWFIGVDTSDASDMTALCLMGFRTRPGDGHTDSSQDVYVYWRVHVPRSTIPPKKTGSKRDAEIREWAAEGHLRVHEGEIDHKVIAEQLTEWVERYRVVSICADQHTAMNEVVKLCPPYIRNKVIRRAKTGQTVTEPMASLAAWTARGEVHYEAHPVAVDHFRNVRIVETREGVRVPTKTAIGGRKIDCVDATLMAAAGRILSESVQDLGKPHAPRELPHEDKAADRKAAAEMAVDVILT